MNKQITDLINRYIGKIEQDDKSIYINEVNTLYHSYNDELNGKMIFIENKAKKVECEISIVETSNGVYTIRGQESTCEIMGGFSYPGLLLEDVIKLVPQFMDEYNFKKNKFEQLALF